MSDSTLKTSDTKINTAIENVLHRLVPETSLNGYWSTLEENSGYWAAKTNSCEFWQKLKSEIHNWSVEYRKQTNSELVIPSNSYSFIGKGQERLRSKTLSLIKKGDEEDIKNIFCTLPTPIPHIDDLVRVRIDTHYLDGVPFLAEKVIKLATDLGVFTSQEKKGSLNGYYAQHIYFVEDVYFNIGDKKYPIQIQCEIQIATVLATKIWDSCHNVYEEWRTKDDKSEEWQWSPEDPRFLSRQLGHMIHLADGILIQLRNLKGKNKNE